MNQSYEVKDGFRTSPLSHVPGGSVIRLVYANDDEVIYNNIKNPVGYLKRVHRVDETRGALVKVFVDNKPWPL